MGGLIVTETVFNIPGVARFLVEAIRWRDYPIVQNLVMFIAIIVVVDQLHRRHAVRGARPADQILATRNERTCLAAGRTRREHASNTSAELSTAGANVRQQLERRPLLCPALSAGRGGRGDHGGLPVRRRSSRRTSRSTTRCRPTPRSRWPRPSAAHWLGCDFMGRDVYSRIIYGARISLAVRLRLDAAWAPHRRDRSACCRAISLGWFDLVTQRVIEMMQSLPLLVMALMMAASLGPSLHNTIIAISIPLVPYSARVDPRQHADAARAALCRGGEGDRHERDRASRCGTCCPTRWRR